jgi:hypothetical protein
MLTQNVKKSILFILTLFLLCLIAVFITNNTNYFYFGRAAAVSGLVVFVGIAPPSFLKEAIHEVAQKDSRHYLAYAGMVVLFIGLLVIAFCQQQ